MGDFSFTVDIPEIRGLGNSFFSSFYAWVASHRSTLETEIKKILQDYARDGHREQSGRHYQNQTYRLRQSTRAEGSFGDNLDREIRLYVDLSQADYGTFVINGNGRGWTGDPFIDETAIAKKPEITKLIVDFFNEAIMNFNRRP